MNIDEFEHALYEARRRVLKIQTKLHRWAHDGSCGEPGALRDARRVREAARRNGTVARLSPRSGPTFTRHRSAGSRQPESVHTCWRPSPAHPADAFVVLAGNRRLVLVGNFDCSQH